MEKGVPGLYGCTDVVIGCLHIVEYTIDKRST